MLETNVQNTLTEYEAILDQCKQLYIKKASDYGTSWRVLRPIALVDQIYIKAWRIRQIQENKIQKINDSIASEFIGIVNYGIIALIQEGLVGNEDYELTLQDAEKNYDENAEKVKQLMLLKNHDYGEAWRAMSQSSLVDLILVKLLRVKQIIANEGKTQVSEGISANFADMINYAIFALIQINTK